MRVLVSQSAFCLPGFGACDMEEVQSCAWRYPRSRVRSVYSFTAPTRPFVTPTTLTCRKLLLTYAIIDVIKS